jgi:hypothetical protein
MYCHSIGEWQVLGVGSEKHLGLPIMILCCYRTLAVYNR